MYYYSCQSEPGSNSNEGVLHTAQVLSITSPSFAVLYHNYDKILPGVACVLITTYRSNSN